MGYTTYVARTSLASSDGQTLTQTLGLPGGATLISVGAVVATPSSSGDAPYTPSQTANIVWLGPGNTSSTNPQIVPSSGTATATNVSSGGGLVDHHDGCFVNGSRLSAVNKTADDQLVVEWQHLFDGA